MHVSLKWHDKRIKSYISYLKFAQMDVEGDYEWNLINDANDETDIDASYNDSSTKVSSAKWIYMIVLIQQLTGI